MRTLMSISLVALLVTPTLWAKDELPYSLQKASDLIGKKVENPQGDNLGKIEEIVLDASNGRIAYAVLSFGGFLGIGDKLFAIPWQALTENREKKVCILNADKDYLKGAPGFDKNAWPDLGDVAWRREVYQFYKIPFNEGEASTQLALTEVRREAAQLPLNLRQGLAVAYDVSCQQEGKDRNISLRVASMSGDEATVEVTCTGKAAAGSEKQSPCTFIVSRDGTVRPSQTRDIERDKTPQPGASATAATDAAEREMALLFVQHVFGQGLHREKLEPGREYTMPGSFHSFHGASNVPATAREEGSPDRPKGTVEGARAVPSSATTAGNHSMRFDGTASCRGQPVAVFTLSHGKGATTERSDPATTRPAEGRPGVARATEACAGCFGKAAYRTSDGLLEAMTFEGASVRRADGGRKPDVGN